MKYLIESQTLTDIADAIRDKAGTSDPIQVSEMDTAIANIPAGGGNEVDVIATYIPLSLIHI